MKVKEGHPRSWGRYQWKARMRLTVTD